MSKTQTKTSEAVSVKLADLVKFETNGNSSRIVVYNHEGWNGMTDLSLSQYSMALAGMEALSKWVSGGFHGNPNLIIVAPTDKFAALNGTGTMAYVSHKYQPKDAVTIDVAGNQIVLSVDPRDIPAEGYARLYLDAGELYGRGHVFTNRDQDPWSYWYCKAAGFLLEGKNNLSVSVGPALYDRAVGVMAVVQADDPAAANELRRFENRDQARFNQDVRTNVQEIKQGENPFAQLAAKDLYVVPTSTGGAVSMETWPISKKVTVISETGRPVNLSQGLGFGTLPERQAVAAAIRERGWKVVL